MQVIITNKEDIMFEEQCEEILNSFREHPVDMEREFFRCSLPTHGESTFYNREVEIGWEDPIKELHSAWK